jgi:hypothetical protein
MGEPEQRFSSTCSRTEKLLPAWATMCGSCAHPDQSPLLARAALLRNDLWVRTSTAILLFFILGGVAIHDCLLSSISLERAGQRIQIVARKRLRYSGIFG